MLRDRGFGASRCQQVLWRRFVHLESGKATAPRLSRKAGSLAVCRFSFNTKASAQMLVSRLYL